MGETSRNSETVDEKVREQDRPQEEEVITLGPNKVGKEHYFELKRDGDGQMVAQCRDCPMGYPIGIETVKNGHIYINGSLVI